MTSHALTPTFISQKGFVPVAAITPVTPEWRMPYQLMRDQLKQIEADAIEAVHASKLAPLRKITALVQISARRWELFEKLEDMQLNDPANPASPFYVKPQ